MRDEKENLPLCEIKPMEGEIYINEPKKWNSSLLAIYVIACFYDPW